MEARVEAVRGVDMAEARAAAARVRARARAKARARARKARTAISMASFLMCQLLCLF